MFHSINNRQVLYSKNIFYFFGFSRLNGSGYLSYMYQGGYDEGGAMWSRRKLNTWHPSQSPASATPSLMGVHSALLSVHSTDNTLRFCKDP